MHSTSFIFLRGVGLKLMTPSYFLAEIKLVVPKTVDECPFSEFTIL